MHFKAFSKKHVGDISHRISGDESKKGIPQKYSKGSVQNKVCSYFVSVRQGGRGGAAILNLSQKSKKYANV